MKWYVKALGAQLLSIMPHGTRVRDLLLGYVGERFAKHVENRLTVIPPLVSLVGRHSELADGPLVVEIGTGWAPLYPVLLGMSGARTKSFDLDRHLSTDGLCDMLELLKARAELIGNTVGCPADEVLTMMNRALMTPQPRTVESVLSVFNVEYVAPADTARLPLPDGSVDVCVSNLVLEHVPVLALKLLLREMFRVLRSGGVAIHRMRMTDEYAWGDPSVTNMNFLRYSSSFWEHFGNNKVKYLNRLRCSQFKDLFERAGFVPLELSQEVDREALAQLANMKIAREFAHLPREDLAVAVLTGVWRKGTI